MKQSNQTKLFFILITTKVGHQINWKHIKKLLFALSKHQVFNLLIINLLIIRVIMLVFLFWKILLLLKLKLPHDALKFINQSIIQQPNYWQAHFNKGLVSILKTELIEYMKNYHEALVCYDAAIFLAPDESKIYFNKGYALRSSGKRNQAADNYEMALIKGYSDPQEIQTIIKQIKN